MLIGTGTTANEGVENAVAISKGAHVTQSNSMNIAVLKRPGGGVLVVDDEGNVTPSDQLTQAMAIIAALTARTKGLLMANYRCRLSKDLRAQS